jgi:hypothetical protein
VLRALALVLLLAAPASAGSGAWAWLYDLASQGPGAVHATLDVPCGSCAGALLLFDARGLAASRFAQGSDTDLGVSAVTFLGGASLPVLHADGAAADPLTLDALVHGPALLVLVGSAQAPPAVTVEGGAAVAHAAQGPAAWLRARDVAFAGARLGGPDAVLLGHAILNATQGGVALVRPASPGGALLDAEVDAPSGSATCPQAEPAGCLLASADGAGETHVTFVAEADAPDAQDAVLGALADLPTFGWHVAAAG